MLVAGCVVSPQMRPQSIMPTSPLILPTFACLCSLAAVEKLRADNPQVVDGCKAAAGLSLGEYTALVFGGAMSLDDALRVVKVRWLSRFLILFNAKAYSRLFFNSRSAPRPCRLPPMPLKLVFDLGWERLGCFRSVHDAADLFLCNPLFLLLASSQGVMLSVVGVDDVVLQNACENARASSSKVALEPASHDPVAAGLSSTCLTLPL